MFACMPGQSHHHSPQPHLLLLFLQNPKQKVRIFRAWKEAWEQVEPGPKGNPILEARLLAKYGGLEWVDADSSDYSRRKAHPDKMIFQKARGNNHYDIVATMDGFDFDLPLDEQEDKYDVWEVDLVYDEIVEFYEKNPDLNVKCYKKGGVCDSDSD